MDQLDEHDDEPADPAELPVFCIWRENRKVWEIWLRLQTQWLITEESEVLSYPGVDVVLRRSGMSRQAQDRMFIQIQHLEAGATKGYAELRAARRRAQS